MYCNPDVCASYFMSLSLILFICLILQIHIWPGFLVDVRKRTEGPVPVVGGIERLVWTDRNWNWLHLCLFYLKMKGLDLVGKWLCLALLTGILIQSSLFLPVFNLQWLDCGLTSSLIPPPSSETSLSMDTSSGSPTSAGPLTSTPSCGSFSSSTGYFHLFFSRTVRAHR